MKWPLCETTCEVSRLRITPLRLVRLQSQQARARGRGRGRKKLSQMITVYSEMSDVMSLFWYHESKTQRFGAFRFKGEGRGGERA
jgi:hypothetical protein